MLLTSAHKHKREPNMNKFDAVANMAFFLLEKTGSVLGEWSGKLSAKEQRSLFGAFLGKGKLHIDGAKETIQHTIKVCFGLDFDVTFDSRWVDINDKVTRMQAPEYSFNSNIPRW